MGNQEKGHNFITFDRRVCVVFGAGSFELPQFEWQSLLPGDTLILCADGGLDNAKKAEIKPHIAIGDFDSATVGLGDIPAIRLPAEKDVTDLQACVEYGFAQGCRDFLLLCCTGGRLDHFLANICLLEWIAQNGGRGYIADARNVIGYLPAGETLDFLPDGVFRYVSVLPVDRMCTDVTLDGLKYPLKNATLHRRSPLGISNEPAGGHIEISSGTGDLLVILSN